MSMKTYLALLRGINVGGNNIIKMAALRACFEELGFERVSSYIQSGNVIFAAAEKDLTRLTETIEAALSKAFSYTACVVVVPHADLRKAVEDAPEGFGEEPKKYRYDVLFLKAPLLGKTAIEDVPVKEGVDTATAGKRVLYFSRLISKATQSRLSKLVSLPIYKQLTIRNWNTTTKLLALMDAAT